MDPRDVPVSRVMSTRVATVDESATLADAMARFDELGVSGAPVVDETGECVGVLSAADVVHQGAELATEKAPDSSAWFKFDPMSERFFRLTSQPVDVADRTPVRRLVSRRVLSVGPQTSLEAAAKLMAREGVHRLLVLEGKSLRGIVSSMDVVRFVAGFDRAEEPRRPARKKKSAKSKASASRHQ